MIASVDDSFSSLNSSASSVVFVGHSNMPFSIAPKEYVSDPIPLFSRVLLVRIYSKVIQNPGFGVYWLGKLRPFLKRMT